MNDLAGRIAIVTGGSGGIGHATITALAAAGATVVNLDISEPDIFCDIRDDASVRHAVTQVIDRYGQINIVIHGSGVSRDGVVWKLPIEEWDLIHEINLRGAFYLLRHAIPAMRINSAGGRIVLIGSINAERGKLGTSAYAASKAGLLGLAKSVSRETGRLGINVNVIEPGWVHTELTAQYPEAVRQQALAETLLGELVEPADVAAAVVFLCGPGSRRITGQVLRVDAGQYL